MVRHAMSPITLPFRKTTFRHNLPLLIRRCVSRNALTGWNCWRCKVVTSKEEGNPEGEAAASASLAYPVVVDSQAVDSREEIMNTFGPIKKKRAGQVKHPMRSVFPAFTGYW